MKSAVEKILLSVAIVLFWMSATVSASSITFQYTGHIDYLPSTGSLPDDFSGQFYVDQTFSGHFTFDPDSPLTSLNFGTKASYANSIDDYFINFSGGLFAQFDNGGMAVDNDRDFGGGDIRDAYVANASKDMPAAVTTNINTPNWSVQEIYMYFSDSTATMFDTYDIPLTAPDIAGLWQTFFLEFKYNGGTATYQISGNIDSLTETALPVPEPGSLFLIGTGLAAALCLRRKAH